MSIAIRANQSGVDQAAAQKAAEKKGHQDVVKSVNAGGFLRKNDTQSQIEARRNNAKKQSLKLQERLEILHIHSIFVWQRTADVSNLIQRLTGKSYIAC